MSSNSTTSRWLPCLGLVLIFTFFASGIMTHHALVEESGEEPEPLHHFSAMFLLLRW